MTKREERDNLILKEMEEDCEKEVQISQYDKVKKGKIYDPLAKNIAKEIDEEIIKQLSGGI